jgi:protein associated with RNAse G/E
LNDDTQTRLYYCNINTPPALDGSVLTYVDLDIDILVQPDSSYQVLDLDEFESHAQRFDYSDETKQQARAAVDELILMIEKREFPFTEEPS